MEINFIKNGKKDKIQLIFTKDFEILLKTKEGEKILYPGIFEKEKKLRIFISSEFERNSFFSNKEKISLFYPLVYILDHYYIAPLLCSLIFFEEFVLKNEPDQILLKANLREIFNPVDICSIIEFIRTKYKISIKNKCSFLCLKLVKRTFYPVFSTVRLFQDFFHIYWTKLHKKNTFPIKKNAEVVFFPHRSYVIPFLKKMQKILEEKLNYSCLFIGDSSFIPENSISIFALSRFTDFLYSLFYSFYIPKIYSTMKKKIGKNKADYWNGIKHRFVFFLIRYIPLSILYYRMAKRFYEHFSPRFLIYTGVARSPIWDFLTLFSKNKKTVFMLHGEITPYIKLDYLCAKMDNDLYLVPSEFSKNILKTVIRKGKVHSVGFYLANYKHTKKTRGKSIFIILQSKYQPWIEKVFEISGKHNLPLTIKYHPNFIYPYPFKKWGEKYGVNSVKVYKGENLENVIEKENIAIVLSEYSTGVYISLLHFLPVFIFNPLHYPWVRETFKNSPFFYSEDIEELEPKIIEGINKEINEQEYKKFINHHFGYEIDFEKSIEKIFTQN